MRISEKQLQMLMIVLKDSCEKNILGMFSFDIGARVGLLNEIINQQSTDLVDTDPKDETNEL